MLPYEEIYDRWERSKSFGDPRDINQFSRDMNQVTGTNDFDLGANAGGWTKFSAAANREFFHPLARGLGLEAGGRAIGGLFGERGRQIGGEIGLAAPRMVAQTIPLIAAEVATAGGATPLVLPLGAAATGGLFGAETYAETQSPTAAAISGVTAAALPYAGKFGGEIGLKAFGPEVERKVVDIAGKRVARTFPTGEGFAPKLRYKAAQVGGAQAGMFGTLEASQFLQSKATGRPFDPLSPEMIAQQIPFTLLDIGKASFTKLPLASQVKGVEPRMPRTERPYTPPPGEPAETANLSEMLDRVTGIAKDQNLTPEEKSKAFTDTLNTVVAPEKAQPKPTDQVILIGHVKPVAGVDNLKMLVQQQKYYDELPEHQNVWVNKFDPKTMKMMTNPDGSTTIVAPRKNVSGNVQYPLGPGDFPALRLKGQARLEPAAPPTGEGVSPETDILSLRQKFGEVTGNNQAMLAAVIAKEPKDPEMAVQHWQQAIEKMTPEHLKPGYVSPFSTDEQRVMKENNVEPETVPVEAPPTPDDLNLPLPEWLREDMVNQGLDPGRTFNDVDLANPSVREAIALDPTLHPDQRDRLLRTGSIKEIKTIAQTVETKQMDLSDAMGKSESVPATTEEIHSWFDRPLLSEDLQSSGNPLGLKPAVQMSDGKVFVGKIHHGDMRDEYIKAGYEDGDISSKGYVNPAGKYLDSNEATIEDTKVRLATEHKAGATQAQAVEKVRLQTQTPQVDRTKQEINIAKDDLKRAAREAKMPKGEKAGFLRDERNKVLKFAEPNEAQATLDAYKTAHPEDPMDYRVTKLRGKYQIRMYPREISLELGRKIEAEAVRATEAEEPETAITGKGIYVPEVDPAAQAEEGILVDPTEGSVPVVAPETRPDISFSDYVNQLDLASNNPTRVMKVAGFDDIPDTILALRQFRVAITEPLREGKTDLKSVNAALKKHGMITFDTEAQMRDTFKMVRDGLDDFQLRYRSKFLDSTVPHDPEVAAATGIQAPNGLARFLEWYRDNKVGTIEGELAEGLRKYSDFSHVDLEFSPEGNFYTNSRITRGRPKITLQRLPSSMDDALEDWGQNVIEEIIHDTTDGLHYRTDPAAIQFKGSLTRIMRTMEETNNIPQAIRNLVKKSKAENWYAKWSEGTMRASEAMGYRPAGNRFLFSMAGYDPTTNKLGGKHTIPRSGLVDETTFGKIGGMEGVPLNKHELALYKTLVPEAFKEGNVDVPLLDRRLQEVGPVVETKTLRQGEEQAPNPEYEAAYAEYNRLSHELETRFPGYRLTLGTLTHEAVEGRPRFAFNRMTREQENQYQALPEELKDLHEKARVAYRRVSDIEDQEQARADFEVGGGGYRLIAPKDESQMPGYVEGLVRLPRKEAKLHPTTYEEFMRTTGRSDEPLTRELYRKTKEKEAVMLEPAKYTGPHFGGEDTNVVSFYRGYEETLPNGEKAFHVIEVQSDWGQKLREQKGQLAKAEKDLQTGVTETATKGKWHFFTPETPGISSLGLVDAVTKEEAIVKFREKILKTIKGYGPPEHPLLSVYNELALKAAIQHAKEIGATKLIVSDAETAMMTEGHDRSLPAMAATNQVPHVVIPAGRYTEVKRLIEERYASGQKDLQNLVLDPTDSAVYAESTGRVEATKQLQKLAELTGFEFNPGVGPTQEKGMRLNYDQALPSAMEKLTRGKGEVVDLGTHKSATDSVIAQTQADVDRLEGQGYEHKGAAVYQKLAGSPYLKDEQGKPKTNVTGRSYDISQLPDEFTLAQRMRGPTPGPSEKFDIYQAYKDAGGTDLWYPVFYALQNEHELTAGIHSSPMFRELMSRTRMPTLPKTILQFFANAWARAFGYSQRIENAFAQMLSSYDTYLAGPRVSKGYNGMSYLRDSALALGTGHRQMASRLEGMDKMYANASFGPSIDAFEREMKDGILPATTVAGPLNQALKEALISGTAKDVKDVAETLLADVVPQHQELWLRLKDDLQAVKRLHGEAKKGNIFAEMTLFQEGLNSPELTAKLNTLKTELDRHGAALARWNTMDALTNSDGMHRLWSSSLKGEKVPDPTEQTGNEDIARMALNLEPKSNEYIAAERRRLAETGEKPLGPIERFAKFASFTERELPPFRPIYATMLETQANAFRRMQEMNVVKNSDPQTKGLNKAVMKANKRVADTPGLNEIVSDMLRRANVMEKEKIPVTLGDPEMQEHLRRASSAKRRDGRSDRDDVITAFNSEGSRFQYRVDRVIPEHFDMANRGLTALAIIGREIGMPSTKAVELADQFHNALRQLRDPAQQVQGAEGLRYLSTQMQPATFLKVMEQTNGFINDAERHIKFLQNNRYYTSEQRYGRFDLVMSREGEPYREAFMSEKQARARANILKKDGWILEDIVPKEAANVAGYLRAEDPMLASQRELDQQTLNRLESLISDLPPERQEMLRPLVQRAGEYEASAAAFSPVPTQASPRRKFRPGRETIDMLANANEETKRFVNWMRNRESRILSSVHMLDPEILANRGLKQYATDFVNQQLAPDSAVARKINEATFYWYLAGNIGNDMLESMQSLTTGMASLISETGSYRDALKYISGASGKVFKRYATGKWGDKESEWYINWLSARGHLGLPTWGDLQDPSTQSYFSVTGPKSDVGKALNAVKEGLRGYKSLFLRHNDMVGGLAGFQLGRDLGMGLEEAARFGEGVKIRGLYTGGKVQRPIGLYNIKEKAVPQLMGSLKTYVLGWFSQLAHNYKIGFANAPGDFTPQQRLGAKKAFMYMLGAQATLAGSLGLPGVGQALALMKQMTGLDLKGWTRKNLAAMFNEDQDDYGGFMTGMALHGLLSQAAPFDISGRQITDVPFTGVSSWKGFDLQNVVPVPFSMAADFIGGLGALAKGQDPAKAFPIALRGPTSLIYGAGDIRNSKGDLIYKLTPSERFFKTLGIEPSRVAAAKETAATVQSMNDAAEARKSAAVDKVADLYRRGDLTGAQRRLADIQRENPTYDMANFVRSVASAVEKRTFPYDWKREVNPALDIVGLANDQPSRELERRQLRQQVSAHLGLYERPNPRQNIRAASVDDLMNSDPYMTRSSALQRLLTARQLRRRNMFSLPEVYQ